MTHDSQTRLTIHSENIGHWLQSYLNAPAPFDHSEVNRAIKLEPGSSVWLARRHRTPKVIPYSDVAENHQLNRLRVVRRPSVEYVWPSLNLHRTKVSPCFSHGVRSSSLHNHAGRYKPTTKPHFLWVTEFPLFTRADEEKEAILGANGRWTSTHHPFTAPMFNDIEKLFSDDDVDQVRTRNSRCLSTQYSCSFQVRGQHYDLVLNGVELGGGSVRVHDWTMQKYIFSRVLQVWIVLISGALRHYPHPVSLSQAVRTRTGAFSTIDSCSPMWSSPPWRHSHR